MMHKRILKLVWEQFTQRKLRSSLTIIGILIGISALVSLIILSSALESGITGQLDRFDANSILIAPLASIGGSSGPQGFGVFTDSDVRVLEQVVGVAQVNPLLSTSVDVRVGRETKRLTLRAPGSSDQSDISFEDFIKIDIRSGRYIDFDDTSGIMVGYKVANEVFERQLFVGNSLYINDKRYTIVGIFKEEGVQESDFAIFSPFSVGRDIVGDSRAVTAIQLQVADGFDFDLIQERVRSTLEKYRGQEDFGITTPQGIRDQIGSFLLAIDIVVLSIALISLFVASLGIMNSLYTSVLQRTKEIGTMKAIGATNSQILFIFVFESAILGFIGGLLGVLFGYMLGGGFIIGVNTFEFIRLPFGIDWVLVSFSLVFSVVLGIISGLLPAFRASKLKPVDALRHD